MAGVARAAGAIAPALSRCGVAERIEALVEQHARTAVWHAIVFDANFPPHDTIRIPAAVMRSDYVQRDAVRTAAFHGVPFRLPSQQCLHTELAARGFHWLADRNPELARAWAPSMTARPGSA